MDNIVIQKFKGSFNTKLERALVYYAIVNSIFSLKLTRKQIELLAYTHIRGSMHSLSAKEGFITEFGSSVDSINNMISKLYAKKLMYKVPKSNKIKVHPKFESVDFNNPEIVIGITLKMKELILESNIEDNGA